MELFDYRINSTLEPFCSVEELAQITGASSEGAELLLSAASDAIRAECGWHIAGNAECEYELLCGGRSVFLPALIVTEITQVFDVKKQRVLTPDEYEWARNGMLRGKFSNELGRYQITYKAGYSETPTALKTMTAQVATAAIKSSYGIASESVGDVSVSYSTTRGGGSVELTDHEKSLLRPYRLNTRF